MSKETERLQREITQKAEQLANARLKEKLQTQMINARKRKTENEFKKKQLSALFRQADAHRKIELGGVVIASGADKLDPAELCGLLLMALRHLNPDKLLQLKEMGLQHFEIRKSK